MHLSSFKCIPVKEKEIPHSLKNEVVERAFIEYANKLIYDCKIIEMFA